MATAKTKKNEKVSRVQSSRAKALPTKVSKGAVKYKTSGVVKASSGQVVSGGLTSGFNFRDLVTGKKSVKKVGAKHVQVTSGKALQVLRDGFGATKGQMAGVLGLKETTYSRREADAKLESVEAHRVHELEETLTLAQQVFHSKEAARDWFQNEVASLQSEMPLAVMAEPGGVGRVKNVLQRIYYGGY